MQTFFKELFGYSNHFNQQLIRSAIEHKEKFPEKGLELLSHLVNAHHIWNSRIQGKAPHHTVWQVNETAALLKLDRENFEISCLLLESEDPDRVVSYTNSAGKNFSNTVRDIFFHVINHSTYHRAQIASKMKEAGIDPLTTDYIFYKR